jgi:hypothetical protein
MDLNPAEGSEISISREGSDPTIVIPQAGSPTRYLAGLFLLCWLGGWAAGFVSAVSNISAGKGSAFLVFWLGAWTIGGIFAATSAYRSFRPTVPETIALRRGSVAYNSGIPPFELNNFARQGRSRSFLDNWSAFFPKRTRVELTQKQLQSLRLRETDLGNRLTIDIDARRIDLASGASEVEREWLAQLLARRYALSQAMGAPSQS